MRQILLFISFMILYFMVDAQKLIPNPFHKKGKGCTKCEKQEKEKPAIELHIISNIRGYINIEFDNRESSDTLLPIFKNITFKSYDNIKSIRLFNESKHCFIYYSKIDIKIGDPIVIYNVIFNISDQSIEDCEYEFKVLSLISSPDMYVRYPKSIYSGDILPEYYMHKQEITFDIFDYFVKSTNFERKTTDFDKYSSHLNSLTGFESKDRKPYHYAKSPNGEEYKLSRYHQDNSFPVVYVNQADISAFLAWLNKLDEEHEYSLPSKLEWEHAFENGRPTHAIYPWGENMDQIEKYANIGDLSLAEYNQSDKTRISENVLDSFPFLCKYHQKMAQNNGLYHMIGNVSEWTSDYQEVVEKDGKISIHYIHKGGSFYTNIKDIDYKRDDYLNGNNRHGRIGFRIVRKRKSDMKIQ